MNYKFDLKRRLFLSQAATNIGLLSASSLFNFKTFAQSAKKNIVFIHFNYSALISTMANKQGEFHLNGGSRTMSALEGYKQDALFIRDSSVKFSTGISGHFPNHVGILTGFAGKGTSSNLHGNSSGKYDGTSVDIVAGENLKNIHNTRVSHLSLAYSSHHADKGGQVNGGFLWRTVSFKKNGNTAAPVGPNKSPVQLYNSMANITNQPCNNQGNNPQNNTEQINNLKSLLNQSQIVANNLKDFKSNYLMPAEQYSKLEGQVARKIQNYEKEISNLESGTETPPSEEEICTNITKPNGVEEAPENNYPYFQNKSNAFFDLIAASFKSNYCRSFTYYTSAFVTGVHDKAHKPVYNNGTNPSSGLNDGGKQIARHNDEVFKSIASLIKKLKAAGVYEDTIIVVNGEFPHQDSENKPTNDHRVDNMPWLVLNSGKNGEYTRQNHGGIIHPGDIHVSLLKKLGINNINTFGSDTHETNRKGNGEKLILG